MVYIEVLVGDASYHGSEALTYQSEIELIPGTLVSVSIRQRQVLGIVVRCTTRKPHFAVKPITSVPELPPLPPASLELLWWIQRYYPSPLGVITQLFLPKQLPKKPVATAVVVAQHEWPQLPPLTREQQYAVDTINDAGLYMLHGDTGTGKTRVYIELAQRSIASGRSALILTPEIGLTSQLAQDFRHVFGDKVAVIHSQLTDVTRQRLWVQILTQQEPIIVVGARSALFSPLQKIGLIVVDEAHEGAYKQDQAPYYHASRIASKLASLHHAPVILGSATPPVTDYYIAKAKNRPIIRMQETATPAVHDHFLSVVDLKDRNKFTKRSFLSDELLHTIGETLARGDQALLFLNRRGTARVIFCEQCGWQADCPHCDLPLVYHGDSHRMRCHSCDYSAAVPTSCPDCQNPSIVFKSIGTKAVVDEVARFFPQAHIQRFDTDNTKSERIEQHYTAVKDGDVDIIVGTQTLAKGLDLPKLGLVGVVIADTSLNFPDFSAQERTYQLLSQVIGRVGRGHRAARVVIQTYAPDSPLLRSIITKDWNTFYNTELRERQEFLFPPFCYLLKLTCRRASQVATIKAAEKFAHELATTISHIRVEGPAPCFHEKIQNKYQWQLIVKSKKREALLDIITRLPSGWSYDIEPLNLL